MTTKALSRCCTAKARVNVRDGGYFCDACGKDCGTKQEASGFGSKASTLSKVRKPTGERDVFIQLWAKCGGKSEVSGTQLLPPEHPQFHFQGSHILPKGRYPDYRLDPRNIVMVTIEEHQQWHEHPASCENDPAWRPILQRAKALKAEAEQKYNTPKP